MKKLMKRVLAVVMAGVLMMMGLPEIAGGEKGIRAEAAELPYTWYLEPSVEAEDILVGDMEITSTYCSYYAVENAAYIKNNGKYGIICYDGSCIVEPEYSKHDSLCGWMSSEILGVTSDDGKKWVHAHNGEKALDVQYNHGCGWGYIGDDYYATDEMEQIIAVSEGSPYVDNARQGIFFKDEYGDREIVIAQKASGFLKDEKPYITVDSEKNLFGIGDRNGILIPCEYTGGISPWNESTSIVGLEKDEKWGYFNAAGECVIDFICDPMVYADVDEFGYPSLDSSAYQAFYSGQGVPYNATEGFIALKVNGECGYYDTEGNEVIPVGTFEEARPVHNGLAWVKDKGTGLWGVIEIDKGSCRDVTFSSLSSSAAINGNGEIYVWGEGAYGDNGYAAAGRLSPNKLNFDQKAVAVSEKYVLTEAGEVYYFDFDQPNPTPVLMLTDVKRLCEKSAITNNGELYLFEAYYDGNGNRSYGRPSTVTKVTALENVVSSCNSGSHVAAVTEDGSLYTWGSNAMGQASGNGILGYISANPEYSDYDQQELYPKKVAIDNVADAKFDDIGSNLYVLKKDGTLYECNYTSSSVSFDLIFDNIKSFECGASFHGGGSVLAISNEDELYVSGSSIWGFGDGNDIYDWENNPQTQKQLSHFGKVKKAITSGNNFAVVTENGSLYTWGQNTYGVVGNREKAAYDSEDLGTPNSEDVFEAVVIFSGSEDGNEKNPIEVTLEEQKLIEQLQNFIVSENYDMIWQERFYDASVEKQWMTLHKADEVLNKGMVSNLCETFDEAGAFFGSSASHTGFDYLLAQMMVSESSYNDVEDMYKTNTWKSWKKVLDVVTKYSKQWVENGIVSEVELNQWRDYLQECIDKKDQEGLVKARDLLSAMASNNEFGENFISVIESAEFGIKAYDKVVVSTVDEVMQYVVYGEAYLETCNEFTEVLYQIADYADYLNKDGATDNELYAVSSSIRKFISDMQRYADDNSAAIATEFAATATENCWSLAEDKLKSTILDSTAEFLDIAPLYKELNIGYKYLDQALNATVNLDNMEKYGQTIEGYAFLSKLLYGVTTDSSQPNAIQEQFTKNPTYENALLFQEATNMKKNMQLLAYDAAIDYFSSMTDNYMNAVNRNDTLRWQNDKNISDLQLEKSIYGGISTNVNDTVYQDMLHKHLESLQNAQTVIVHCPVALQVTDAEGNVVASLSQEKAERIEEYFYLCDTYGYDRDVKIATVKANDQFYIKGMGDGTMSLEIIDDELTYMFTDIPVTDTMNAQFEVSSSGDGILTQTDNLTTVTYKATIMGKVTLGDLNSDTKVNASDAAMVLIAAANIGAGADSGLTPEQTTAADVNDDTYVNASDAAIILQYAAEYGAGYTGTLEDFLNGAT